MVLRSNGGYDDANETTSLLSSATDAYNGPANSKQLHRTRCSWPWVYVVMLCIGVAVTVDIGDYLFLAPKVRLFESVICTHFYQRENPSLVGSDGSVPENFCKVDAVQDEVAMILGWQLFFDSIPAIVLPIPYGYLADTYGRKWFMVLSMIGYFFSLASTMFMIGVLHLPLQYVWLSSLFFLVGGGPTTGSMLLTTVVADVAPPAKRSSVFFYRFTSDLIAECLVPPITSILMAKSLWLPLLAALGFQLLGVLLTFVLPETLPIESSGQDPGVFDDNQPVARIVEADEGLLLENERENDEKWKIWIRKTRKSFSFVTRDATVVALVFTFLISKVGRQSINILLQYVSKRYDWSLSKAGLLSSLRAAVNILLYTVVLPSIAAFALSKTSPASKDLWIAQGSIILMILGTLLLSISVRPALMVVGLVVYTLGTGFSPVVRSLITSLVESHHASEASDIGRLYAIISVMEGIGSLVAGPGMAWAFRVGISLGSDWLGLPFALAASLFALISIVIFWVKV